MKRNKGNLAKLTQVIHERIMARGTGVDYDHDPEKLLDAFRQWVEFIYSGEADWTSTELKTISLGGSAGSKVDSIDVAKTPPMTISNFRNFAGIEQASWECYTKDPDLGLISTTEFIIDTIKDDQFIGAAIGAFNPSVVKPMLELVDRQATEHNGSLVTEITGMKIL